MQKALEGERLLGQAVIEVLRKAKQTREELGPAEIGRRAGIHTINRTIYKGPISSPYGNLLVHGILNKLLA